MPRTNWLPVCMAAIPPFALSVWLSVPFLQPTPHVVEGHVSQGRACLVACSDVLAVGSVQLACQYDFSGFPHDCRDRLMTPGFAKVTYASLPSVARLLALAPTSGVVTRIERDGMAVYSKTVSSHAWSAMYGGWVFPAVYWPLVALLAWLWPKSAMGRRFKASNVQPRLDS